MSDIPQTMRGAMLLGPEHIETREVPVPRPGTGELLLKVEAATTCGTDVKVFKRGGHPRMLKVPTLFGHEMAGWVALAGDDVDDFAPGDGVVISNSASCGRCRWCEAGRENLCDDLQYLNGAFAEYLLVPARFVTKSTYRIPEKLAFGKAALTEPLACVLHGVDACELERHQNKGAQIVVFGAGPIGQLFVAALAREGHQVILADPNAGRLGLARTLGAHDTQQIERGGGQATLLRELTDDGQGADVAIDCTGVPEVWGDAIDVVRPGGLVNLFGGCSPGTSIELDTHRVHYSEITIKGVYHHRPATIRRALSLLAEPDFLAELLLTREESIEGVESALRGMMSKEAMKVVIKA